MTDKLTAQLAQVEADISAAREATEQHRATWKHQCSNGMFGAAEATEEAIVAGDRRVLRYTVRREALEQQLQELLNPQPAEA